jgi:5'-nucleotidase
VHFPLVAANIYTRDSLMDSTGEPVDMNQDVPEGTNVEDLVDWSRAARPDFVKPYVIKTVAGVRVALIGLENHGTPSMTTAENVQDLYFRDPLTSYLEIRASLEGRADVFVMMAHLGNSITGTDATDLVQELTAHGNQWHGSRAHILDAFIAAHTHFVHDKRVNGIPVIQSGTGGDKFGRIDLIWNTTTRQVITERTRGFAGVPLYHDACSGPAREFCSVDEAGQVSYEDVPVRQSPAIDGLIAAEHHRVAPLGDRTLGSASEKVTRDRVNESPLSDQLTDALRRASGADVAMMNTGGLRTEIEQGSVTYASFFEVLPFSNHAVILGPVTAQQMVALLQRSAQTCGGYSALMQSGLKVTFHRQCQGAQDGKDPNAELLRVERLDGRVLYDKHLGGIQDTGARFTVATFDFLTDGGSGYDDFVGIPVKKDLGIMREMLTTEYLKHPVQFSATVDGRWKDLYLAP